MINLDPIRCSKAINHIGYDIVFHSGFSTDFIRYKDIIVPYDDFKWLINNRITIGFFTSK